MTHEDSEKRRTVIQRPDTFTAICCLVCFVLLLAAWAFVAIPVAAHYVDVILSFWGLKK